MRNTDTANHYIVGFPDFDDIAASGIDGKHVELNSIGKHRKRAVLAEQPLQEIGNRRKTVITRRP